ncbi:MAG: hypothetical protein LUD47_04910, partial [Clostridia bacterium]|nr:hypothetical protein [Clostridia bacterium]
MNSLDIRFDSNTISLFRSFVGLKLDKAAFLVLPRTIEIYGMAVLQINGILYSLTSYYEPLDYLGNGVDDVGVLKFRETSRSVIEEYESFICPPQKLPETDVGQVISEIEIVNENRKLFDREALFGNFDIVKGIVFKLKDGLEIAFEKDN